MVLIPYLEKAGVDITWIDNDSGCKGVCARVKTLQIETAKNRFCDGNTCKDEVILNHAINLSQHVTKDSLIVFHLIGSHGPRYYERYPEKFRKYTPDCNRPDVENCTIEELRNAYDNTILYTDYVIYELISILEKHMDTNEVMLLYVSDHGESLGENNVYLHASPYAIAPDEQIKVPLQLWLPDKTANDLSVDKACLKRKAKTGSFSHDNIFHSIMGLMQVRSSEYHSDLDLLSDCLKKK